eukprot:1146446-Pelagomonas_calceolata.AAC.2
MARRVEVMGNIDIGSPTYTQKDCVESDLSALKLCAQLTVLLLLGLTAKRPSQLRSSSNVKTQ